ncbi:MAG: winged helix-turn-helix domain-containing protein [Lachnospiraceae bacterium]|nr:winged helix-turn-helix domain-containing protein [Lachnospiraceae bacterium]
MAEKKGNSLLETKRKNRVFIKNLIYKQKNATRTAIADELGLTLATISTSINEMIRNEIIEEAPADDSFTGMGRRPMILRFKPDAAFCIGVDMGA